MSDTKKKIYEILNSYSTAMFVTVSADGWPESRPMHVAQVDEEAGTVWFFTGVRGTVASEVQSDAIVLLSFQSEKSAYLSMRGHAHTVRDRELIKKLWKEPYKVWFPGGVDDPEITLVAVNPIDAEYWDNSGMNKLKYIVEAAKAYVKGEKPHVDEVDQHAKATL